MATDIEYTYKQTPLLPDAYRQIFILDNVGGTETNRGYCCLSFFFLSLLFIERAGRQATWNNNKNRQQGHGETFRWFLNQTAAASYTKTGLAPEQHTATE